MGAFDVLGMSWLGLKAKDRLWGKFEGRVSAWFLGKSLVLE